MCFDSVSTFGTLHTPMSFDVLFSGKISETIVLVIFAVSNGLRIDLSSYYQQLL